MTLAAIEIGIDPYIQLGPLRLAWHGIMIAVGILVGSRFAARYARERGLQVDQLTNVGLVMALAGIVGARAFYLIERDPADLLRPDRWLGTFGFSFYGALILAALAIAVYVRRRRLSLRYLDVVAVAFPIGMAVGRVGDIINGEHHGPPSDAPWALRHTHPDASVPTDALAYHDGGLYEATIALFIFALVWPLRHRFRRPLMGLWTVVGLYAIGRFVEFFYRSDSAPLALGLNGAQWTSLALLAVAIGGAWWSRGRRPRGRAGGRAGPAVPRNLPAPGPGS